MIRAALIPLFVKQIKSSRNMQLIQPKVKELQKKYGHDRERLAQETMKLYKDSGTNPFASCLPILLQMPIFFALFRLLDQASKARRRRGLTTGAGQAVRRAELFGGADLGHLPQGRRRRRRDGPGGRPGVAMTATTFLTQRQLMSKNMPADALTGPYAQQQKMLLYVLPVVFAVGGIAFPIGVLLYWTTSNLWTMGQQFYVIRNNPAPGTPAAQAKEERDRHKAAQGRQGRSAVARRAHRVAERRAAPPRAARSSRRSSRAKKRRRSGGRAAPANKPPTEGASE